MIPPPPAPCSTLLHRVSQSSGAKWVGAVERMAAQMGHTRRELPMVNRLCHKLNHHVSILNPPYICTTHLLPLPFHTILTALDLPCGILGIVVCWGNWDSQLDDSRALHQTTAVEFSSRGFFLYLIKLQSSAIWRLELCQLSWWYQL